MRVPVYGVGAGHAQRQQAEIVQRAEPDIGLKRRRGARQRLLSGLQVSPGEGRGPGVVPGGVILATVGELGQVCRAGAGHVAAIPDRKSTRLNSSHMSISYAVFCLKKKKTKKEEQASTMRQIY